MMMVRAGHAVDDLISGLTPHLESGDIIIDGGNSHFTDTIRRCAAAAEKGILYVGAGVSGGEEGALHGPSIMPGGHPEAWFFIKPVFQAIAAKVEDGSPCCEWLGPDGAGHFVKMVHNGIEYGIMQTICEAYDLLRSILGLSATEVHDVFAEWNAEELNSFLLEISVVVLKKTDPETGKPLVDLVLDTAEQKGTGKWTAQDALDLGVAVPTLTSAVLARIVSGLKQERVSASEILRGPKRKFGGDRQDFIARLRDAYALSVIACYAQGFAQLRAASKEYGYNLKFTEIARIWRGGCIIRAKLLEPIRAAYKRQPDLANLMLDRYFRGLINKTGKNLRKIAKLAVDAGVPCPALFNSLTYIDSCRQARLPANLLQAQRDYFGAHTYRRIDKEGVFHTDWDKQISDC